MFNYKVKNKTKKQWLAMILLGLMSALIWAMFGDKHRVYTSTSFNICIVVDAAFLHFNI